MTERIAFIGHDRPEAADLQARCPFDTLVRESLPRIRLQSGTLFVESPRGYHFEPVTRVVFHGIFERDVDFLSALALWGGPCFPEPLPMLDCRLRLPCLARALTFTRFGGAAARLRRAGRRVRRRGR